MNPNEVSLVSLLPAQFADLERFVRDGWAESVRRNRTEKRLNSSFAQIQEFYDAVVPKLHEILASLDQHPLDALTQPERNLLNLTFMVAEVRHAVESFGQPDVVDGWDTRSFIIEDPLQV